jgi:hypothetical protein
MVYAIRNTQAFVDIVEPSLAQSLPPEGEYRITRIENLQELPTSQTDGRFHKIGNRQRIEWNHTGRVVVIEWEVVHGEEVRIPSGQPIFVRVVESKRVPRQGMTLHMRRKPPWGYHLILRGAGGESLGLWEVIWNS